MDGWLDGKKGKEHHHDHRHHHHKSRLPQTHTDDCWPLTSTRNESTRLSARPSQPFSCLDFAPERLWLRPCCLLWRHAPSSVTEHVRVLSTCLPSSTSSASHCHSRMPSTARQGGASRSSRRHRCLNGAKARSRLVPPPDTGSGRSRVWKHTGRPGERAALFGGSGCAPRSAAEKRRGGLERRKGAQRDCPCRQPPAEGGGACD